MSGTESIDSALVSRAQLQRWEREYANLGATIQKIEERRAVIKTMIDAALALTGGEPTHGLPSDDAAKPPKPRGLRRSGARRKRARIRRAKPAVTPSRQPAARATNKRSRPETSEWKPIIREIVFTAPHQPVSYPEAKEEILKTELADKFRRSDKGFYNSIGKLHKAGEIVSYKAHLFTPEAFKKFEEDLAAGRVRDVTPVNAAHRSPMGEATLEILRKRPRGAESGHLIWELRKNPEFAEQIEKNKTHPYNVFKRLINRREIVKRGSRYYCANLKTETPSTKEGAPITSESRGAAAKGDIAQGSLLG